MRFRDGIRQIQNQAVFGWNLPDSKVVSEIEFASHKRMNRDGIRQTLSPGLEMEFTKLKIGIGGRIPEIQNQTVCGWDSPDSKEVS
jgi:hypothetical protein